MEDAAQLWFCHSQACPFVIGCLRCVLPGISVQDAVTSIQCPRQRMAWDGDSFSSFEVLREHDPMDETREDIVFTVMTAPSPVSDREILQYRWQVSISDDGAQALLMQSFEDESLRSSHPKRVRAFTHLSGYLLRPLQGQENGVEAVVISQCDLGGGLPSWFQNMARRLAKRRCLAWGQKLRAHCSTLAQARADAVDRSATAS